MKTPFKTNKYIGIIGYLTESGNSRNREQSISRLRDLFNKINDSFHDSIEIKFTMISNLKFTGAVKRNFPFQDFLALYQQEYGKNIGTHFGIGLGELGLQAKKPGGCFYVASKALAQAKEKGEFLLFHNFEMNEALNSLYYFLHEVEEKFTDRQRQVIELYRDKEEIVTVANKLYLSKQAVADSIKAAKFQVYKEAWKGIQQLLLFEIKSNIY